ncbi:MAG TPA: 3-methyladenine DNA glycosylase, partial [Microterricola sp.]
PPFTLQVSSTPLHSANGPRTGVGGDGGGSQYPWRFWLPGDEGVSPYRRHKLAAE